MAVVTVYVHGSSLPGCRLIEHNDLSFPQQSSSDAKKLPLALREALLVHDQMIEFVLLLSVLSHLIHVS